MSTATPAARSSRSKPQDFDSIPTKFRGIPSPVYLFPTKSPAVQALPAADHRDASSSQHKVTGDSHPDHGDEDDGPLTPLPSSPTKVEAEHAAAPAAPKSTPAKARKRELAADPKDIRRPSMIGPAVNEVDTPEVGSRTGKPSPSSSKRRKGKGRAADLAKKPEKRVLPQRIRRAAGGGAEGVRDLDEIVVDWLDRFGEPCDTPPNDIPIYLTTLPLSHVEPAPFVAHSSAPSLSSVTITPSRATHYDSPPLPSALVAVDLKELQDRIETPSFVSASSRDDDIWEASEELDAVKYGFGSGTPVKRLRTAGHNTLDDEDTSDAYYMGLHRKYEVFERRQRRREKEKLLFERYKLRSRIDHLRIMSTGAWKTVVTAILSRYPSNIAVDSWTKGREQVEHQGFDWLRHRLIREGLDVLRRYDQLLPTEPRKLKPSLERQDSTPSRTTASPSLSPPPALPSRVSALRELTAVRKRRHSDPPKLKPHRSPVVSFDVRSEGRTRLTQSHGHAKRYKASLAKRKAADRNDNEMNDTPTRFTRSSRISTQTLNDREDWSRRTPDMSSHNHSSMVHHKISPLSPSDPFFRPPQTVTGFPCLVEAAQRRETAQIQVVLTKEQVATAVPLQSSGKRRTRRSSEKTRASESISSSGPFGLPIPDEVGREHEFTLREEEDFKPFFLHRTTSNKHLDKSSALTALASPSPASPDNHVRTSSAMSDRNAPETLSPISNEDAMEMREVEASVVI